MYTISNTKFVSFFIALPPRPLIHTEFRTKNHLSLLSTVRFFYKPINKVINKKGGEAKKNYARSHIKKPQFSEQ